jgi:hypothetical protein
MKITIESTREIVAIDGIEARLWNGRTAGGIRCTVFVCRIAVHKDESQDEFQRELQDRPVPAEITVLDPP